MMLEAPNEQHRASLASRQHRHTLARLTPGGNRKADNLMLRNKVSGRFINYIRPSDNVGRLWVEVGGSQVAYKVVASFIVK